MIYLHRNKDGQKFRVEFEDEQGYPPVSKYFVSDDMMTSALLFEEPKVDLKSVSICCHGSINISSEDGLIEIFDHYQKLPESRNGFRLATKVDISMMAIRLSSFLTANTAGSDDGVTTAFMGHLGCCRVGDLFRRCGLNGDASTVAASHMFDPRRFASNAKEVSDVFNLRDAESFLTSIQDASRRWDSCYQVLNSDEYCSSEIDLVFIATSPSLALLSAIVGQTEVLPMTRYWKSRFPHVNGGAEAYISAMSRRADLRDVVYETAVEAASFIAKFSSIAVGGGRDVSGLMPDVIWTSILASEVSKAQVPT